MEQETQEQVTEQKVDLWSDTDPVLAPSQPDEPIVEPVIEPEPTPEVTPVVEQKQEPVIQEKIVEVEKIIEKLPEFKDEYSKSIYQAIAEGKEDQLYNYFQEKLKDYNSMSEIDLVKEKLQKENPNWTSKDIEVEVKHKYGKNLEFKDLDGLDEESKEYEQAVSYNEQVERNLNLLERDARDSRQWLNEQKKNIELPKINTEPVAPQTQQYTQEEIDAFNKQWEETVEAEIPNLSDLSWKVGDEEVSYKTTDEDKAGMKEFMKNFNDVDYLTKRGWYDDKGQINVLKVAEDVRILENIDKIISATVSQSKVSATKEVVADIKNINFSKNTQSAAGVLNLGDKLWE